MSKKTAREKPNEAMTEKDLFDEARDIIHEASVKSVGMRGRPLRVVEAGVEDDVIVMLFQGMSVYTIHERLKREQGEDISVSALYRVRKSIGRVLDDPKLQNAVNMIGTRLDVLEQLQWLLAESKERIVRMRKLESLVVTPTGNAAIEQHRRLLELYQECFVGRLSGNRPGVAQMVRAMRKTTPEGCVEEGIELVRKIDDPELLERLFRAVGIERPVIDLDHADSPSSGGR